MPMNKIKGLLAREAALGDWRGRLTSNDFAVVKCEAAYELYREDLDLLFVEAQVVSETKGLQAGLKLAKPELRAVQDENRTKIANAEIEAEVGNAAVKALGKAADGVQRALEGKREEMMRAAGKVDAIEKSAQTALSKIETVVANHERQLRVADDEDDDWSGRGTANGQREVPAKNGKKTPRKKTARRKKATKKAEATN